MSKLSEKLCKIAEIKPKYKSCRSCKPYGPQSFLFDDKWKAQHYSNNDYKVEERFPNFETNAGNFVKLFELKVLGGDTTVMGLLKDYWRPIPWDIKSFLTSLIDMLEHGDEKIVESTKQVLQNKEWNY